MTAGDKNERVHGFRDWALGIGVEFTAGNLDQSESRSSSGTPGWEFVVGNSTGEYMKGARKAGREPTESIPPLRRPVRGGQGRAASKRAGARSRRRWFELFPLRALSGVAAGLPLQAPRQSPLRDD